MTVHLHWSRVANGLSELTRDLVLGREVDLLEQLRRDGQAARGLDLPQRIIGIMVVIEMVACNVVSPSSMSAFNLARNVLFEKSFSSGAPP